MLQINKILCPVDFLPDSHKALEYAAGLAEDYGAKVHLLHIVSPLLPVAQDYPVGAVAVMESVEEAVCAHMKRLVQNFESRGIQVTGKVLTGDIHRLIEETINSEKPDLIVMGSHARSGLERLFMGSVAEWLMRNSPVPIVVISEKQQITVRKPLQAA